MIKSQNFKLLGFGLVLSSVFLLSGCGQDNPNYKAPGTGTFDNSKNPFAEGNMEVQVKACMDLARNPGEKKSKQGCYRLGHLGAAAESAIPFLEELSESSDFDSVKEEAKKAIEMIKADVAEKSGEGQ